MALIAETLVEEWLNRNGYFTVRGIKEGVNEIDLLAVKPRDGGKPEALHVEVQVSFRPVGYISKLTKNLQKKHKKAAGSVYRRNRDELKECVNDWTNKKYLGPKKVNRRNSFWPDLNWNHVFVHAVAKFPEELELIEKSGIELVPFEKVLRGICENENTKFRGAAGGDLADIIEFYNKRMSD